MYFSIHRYEHGNFWPNLRESDFDYVGKDKGAGYNFNIPLNNIGMADADYLAIFQQVLLPMACEVSSFQKFELKTEVKFNNFKGKKVRIYSGSVVNNVK